MRCFHLPLALIGIFTFTQAQAQGNDCPIGQDARYEIGVFASHAEPPYRDWNGSESQVLPNITVEKNRFYLKGPELGYILSDCESIDRGYQLNLIARLGTGGYDESDSDFLVGMDDRDDLSFSVGVSSTWQTEYGTVNAKLTQDIADSFDGLLAELNYSAGISSDDRKLTVQANVGFNYYSEDFNDYYYGVENNEARLFRPAYQAGSSWNPVLGVTLLYFRSQKSTLYTSLNYQKLDDVITDSPIVSEDEITTLAFGYTYKLQ